jgi:Flp pilus assembly protein TadD
LFYEHVHFTFEGNYLLAAAAYPVVAQAVAGRAASRLDRVPNPPSLVACAERLAFTGWNRYKIVSDILAMTARPPFANQVGHDAKQASLAQALKSLSPFLTKEQLLAARATYERALARAPGDILLRIEYVRLLSVLGDFNTAEGQWRSLVADLPQDPELNYSLGTALLRLGRIDEARRSLLEALRLRPDYSLAHGNLAIALSAEGRTAQAMSQCWEAIRCDPANEAAHCNLAKMLLSAGRNAEAAAQAREALRLHPGWEEAARVLKQAERDGSGRQHP